MSGGIDGNYQTQPEIESQLWASKSLYYYYRSPSISFLSLLVKIFGMFYRIRVLAKNLNL